MAGYRCSQNWCVPGDRDGGVDGGKDAGTGFDAAMDASHDGSLDSGMDSGHDAGVDSSYPSDGSIDAGSDSGGDAGIDAGFDAGIDAGVFMTEITPDNPLVTVEKGKQFYSVVSGAADTSILWSITGGKGYIDPSNGLFTAPNEVGNVTITATSNADNSVFRTTTAQIVAAPAITSFQAGNPSLLYGESTTLTGVFSDGTGVVNHGVGEISSGTAKEIGPLTAPIVYTLTVTNAAGDGTSADAAVAVSEVSIGTIAPSSPYVTVEATQQFSATVTGSIDATVLWNAGAGNIDDTGNFTAPASSGDVTITATSHADSTKQISTTAHVVAAPIAVVTTPQYATANLTGYKASVPSGQVGMTYDWTVTNGTITAGSGTSEIIFSVGSSGTVSVKCTVTNQAGTSASDTKTTTIVAAPSATVSVPVYVTANKAGYKASVPSGQVGMIYDWVVTNANVTAGTGTREITFTPGASGTVTLKCTVTNQAGTAASDIKARSIVAPPAITSFSAGSSTINYGASTTLTGVFTGSSGSVNNGVGSVTSGVSKAVGPLIATVTYTLTVYNLAGDSTTANTTVNVNQVSISDITPANPDVSAGRSKQFSATVTGAFDTTVDWTVGAGSIDSTGKFTAPAVLGGVTITAKSHADPSKYKTTMANVVPAPEITSFSAGNPAIAYGDSTTLTAVFGNGTGSVDNGVGTVTSGVAKTVGPLTATTTFILTVTNSAGDSTTSNVTVFVYVAQPTINPGSGTYSSMQLVTLSCSTSGADIYFTTDGSTPSTSSYKYSTQIAVSDYTTINAIAAKSGCMNSAVSTATYVIPPAGRSSHVMAYDSYRERVVLSGGCCDTGGGPRADTWEWDGNLWKQKTTTGPAGVSSGAAYDSYRRTVVMFGGKVNSTRQGNTWEWDGGAWTLRSTTGPSARTDHAMAYDSARNRTVLFGGYDGAYKGDTWEWDGSAWTLKATTGPAAREAAKMAYDSSRGRVVLFGGSNGSNSYFGDTWEWDGSSWAQKSTTGPDSRASHALVFDSSRARTVLFGGYYYYLLSGEDWYRDTWEWNGSSWNQRSNTGPVARRAHAMAFDSKRGRTVLFGGYDNNIDRSDTWEWDGNAGGGAGAWTQR